MSTDETVSSLLTSLNIEAANAKKWQSKAATQADEIKRLSEAVQRLRKDKLQLLADLKKAQNND
jgi:hypothetical protein